MLFLFQFLFLLQNAFAESSPSTQMYYSLSPGYTESQSYDVFINTLLTTKATILEDFLGDWKQADPLVFRYYVLGFRSRSLQSSTPQAPRAVLFSPQADFVASFNSHNAQRGSQNIEMIRFDHATDRFEFREVTFNNQDRPQLSEANPKKCLGCHQAFTRTDIDPRPNWEPYFMWPGFFGMVDGPTLQSERHLDPAERSRLDPLLDQVIINETNHEAEWYEYFWKEIAPHDARYSLITPFDKELAKEDKKKYGRHADRDLKTVMFTQRLAELNFRRVARIMTEDEELFDFLKEAVNGVMHCGVRVMPEEFLRWLQQNSSIPPESNLLNLNLGDKIKLLFEPFYYDTDDWSMDFKTNGRFAFSNRFGTPGLPEAEFSKAIAKRSTVYAALRNAGCRGNEVEQFKKYKNLQTAIHLQEQRSGDKDRLEGIKNAPLINRCIRCHANGNDITVPHIPFDNEFELQSVLRRTGYKRGRLFDEIVYRIGVHAESDEQMPPQSLPSVKQREDLIKYLTGLMQVRQNMEPF